MHSNGHLDNNTKPASNNLNHICVYLQSLARLEGEGVIYCGEERFHVPHSWCQKEVKTQPHCVTESKSQVS
jgi:hypothetical protein